MHIKTPGCMMSYLHQEISKGDLIKASIEVLFMVVSLHISPKEKNHGLMPTRKETQRQQSQRISTKRSFTQSQMTSLPSIF